jgi:hypothetical protein
MKMKTAKQALQDYSDNSGEISPLFVWQVNAATNESVRLTADQESVLIALLFSNKGEIRDAINIATWLNSCHE